MTVLTASEITLLRTQPHKSVWNLFIYQPATIFTARVNNSSAASGDTTILYSNSVGMYTNIQAGMTMYVGSASGLDDLGRIRVRSATASQIVVAENNDIVWTNGAYLTVIAFYEPWAVYPYISIDPVTFVPTFYKDKDIAYTNQNSVFDPIPMMGPNLAAIIDASTGLATLYFDGSSSYDMNSGGSITSYSWTFESSNITSYNGATPGNVTWNTPGDYVVSLTVTNNNGKTFTGRRHVCIRTAFGGSNPPIRNWGVNNLSWDYAQGGWSGRIWMRQDTSKSVVRDGALVMIVADDTFGSTQQSIGGNYENRENLVFVGYVRNGSITVDPTTSLVEFDIVNLAEKLDVSESFSVTVKSSASPTTWYELLNLTCDLAVMHYIRWHTTIYTIADVNKNGDTQPILAADFSREQIRVALDSFLASALLSHFCVDRQGQVWMEKNVNIVPINSRTTKTSLDMIRRDWRDALRIEEVRDTPVSYVELGGVQYDGPAVGTFTALISSAPGQAPKYMGHQNPVVNGLALTNQSTTNQLAGNYLAMQNRKYSVAVSLAGNYRIFDVAPQERLLITLTENESYRELNWWKKKFIPRSGSLQYDRKTMVCLAEIIAEEETDGPAGVAGPYPQSSIYDGEPIDYTLPDFEFPDLPTPIEQPVIAPVQGNGNLVYAVTNYAVARTRNFLAVTPNWESVTSAITTGTIKDFAMQPWTPKYKAGFVSTNGIWLTSTLDSSPPTWTNVQTAAQFLAATGKTLSAYIGIRYTIAQQDLIYVQAVTADNYLYIGRTSNGGTTWVWKQIGTTTITAVHGFMVSQHVATKVWTACGNGNLYYSSNATAAAPTYTSIYSVTGATAPLTNIEVPYDNNASDQVVWISTNGGAESTARYDSNDGWTYAGGNSFACGANLTLRYNDPCTPVSSVCGVPLFTTSYGTPTYDFTVNQGLSYDDIDFGIVQPVGATVKIYIGTNNYASWGGNYALSVDGITWTGYSAIPVPGVFGCGGILSNAMDVGGYRYFRLYEASSNREIHFYYGAVFNGYKFSSPKILKSGNGGYAFTDVTPSGKGAIGFRGLLTWTQDKLRAMALVGTSASSLDLVESLDDGASWSTKQSALATPVSVGRWPYNTLSIFLLQGAAQNKINYSNDGGTTLYDRTGDWLTAIGQSFSNPVTIVPVWTEPA